MLCFHLQQAVEKSIKAILVSKNIAFPKTHNIRTLLDLLPKEIYLPKNLQKTAKLTDYSVSARYPGGFEPVKEKEYLKAFSLTEKFYTWVQKKIEEKIKLKRKKKKIL
jgi:HEPN domain-containing protein